MYGLPTTMDLSFMLGKPLLQVCFGANDLVLNFDRDLSITLTAAIGVGRGSAEIIRTEEFDAVAADLLALLGRSVVSAEPRDGGTCRMLFEVGIVVELYDDSKQFESYVIHHGEKLIVV